MDTAQPSFGGVFPTTHLSMIHQAAIPGSPGFRAAWEGFFKDYWPPLYTYLRRKGCAREEARDILQDFFIEGLDGRYLARYDPAQGRLRTWLLACLRNHRIDADRKRTARPDHGAMPLFSDDDVGTLESNLADSRDGDPDLTFEREWASHVFRRSLDSLEGRLRGLDPIDLSVFTDWVRVTPETRPEGSSLAASLGISTEAMYMRASRIRKAIEREIVEQVRQFSPSAADVGLEVDEVLRCLAGRPAER